MRKIGLDIGSKTCGVALSDSSNIIAVGKENIKFEERNWKSMFNKLDKYFKKYEIDTIVIGYPKLPSGDKSKTTIMIEEVEKLLKKRYLLPIKRVKEYFSTKKAHQILIGAQTTRKKRKNLKDQVSAQILLTDYLTTL